MKRVCAQCGKVEPGWFTLMFAPGRMFKIWKGSSHDVDLCTFECERKYYRGETS